ncbi:hypothetical protein DCC81_23605 [Chitinophaga parva]|uniref:Uncharacterized protein n=1 Tax=Chitinophaga parva TaxID=2169414 RepID=A0A2T7BE61_9BACT|nr:hypothetical protein DCC81_23605 [Chitinophaga parva]
MTYRIGDKIVEQSITGACFRTTFIRSGYWRKGRAHEKCNAYAIGKNGKRKRKNWNGHKKAQGMGMPALFCGNVGATHFTPRITRFFRIGFGALPPSRKKKQIRSMMRSRHGGDMRV